MPQVHDLQTPPNPQVSPEDTGGQQSHDPPSSVDVFDPDDPPLPTELVRAVVEEIEKGLSSKNINSFSKEYSLLGKKKLKVAR